jgi:hypothetical protein
VWEAASRTYMRLDDGRSREGPSLVTWSPRSKMSSDRNVTSSAEEVGRHAKIVTQGNVFDV